MSRYEKMLQRQKNFASEATYFNFLLTALCNMFTWKGIPTEQRHLEEYLHTTGSFAVQPSDKVPEGFLFVPMPNRSETLDQFGEGTVVQGNTIAGNHPMHGVIDKTVTVCYNNSLHVMDWDIVQYANYLASVDKAMLINTKLSGFAPILCAQDSKSHKAIDNLLNQLLEGNVKVIRDNELFDSLLQSGPENLYSVDITNPQRVTGVQYQSLLWFDFMKRFFSKYGIDITTTNKKAQVSSAELQALDAYSWIIPLDMLKERQAFCERTNKLFGTDWSVDFSELWLREYGRYQESIEEEVEEDASNEGDSEVSVRRRDDDDNLSE